MSLAGLVVFLSVGHVLSKSNQCSLILDTLTGGKFDYLYKRGTAISLEPPRRLNLECVPEYNRNYSNTVCQWIKNSKEYTQSVANTRDFFTNDRCLLRTYPNQITNVLEVGGNTYNNLTCLTVNTATGRQTIMTYLIFFLSDNTLLAGFRPLVSYKEQTRQTKVGRTENAVCEVDSAQASSVFHLNWFLIDEKENRRVDVRELEGHSLSTCNFTLDEKKKIQLTLTISDITEDMLNNKYECVVSKVDFLSPYNKTLHTYNLHSADLSDSVDRDVIPKPDMTHIANLTYYENGTKGICTLDQPCMASLFFSLTPPEVVLISVATYIAVGASAIVAVFLASIIILCCLRRIPVQTHLKHHWAITGDVVSSEYEYQAVVFYAEDCKEEEEQFVQSNLLVHLENQWRFKVFVPQRNFIAGSTKAEECVRALRSSQKVIFILTESLFAEEWRIYALDVALNKHRKIIIIKLENIDFQKLLEKHNKKFSEVESALKVSTVIDWTKDKDKWQRLLLEMPAIVKDCTRHQMTSCLRKYHTTREKKRDDKSHKQVQRITR